MNVMQSPYLDAAINRELHLEALGLDWTGELVVNAMLNVPNRDGVVALGIEHASHWAVYAVQMTGADAHVADFEREELANAFALGALAAASRS